MNSCLFVCIICYSLCPWSAATFSGNTSNNVSNQFDALPVVSYSTVRKCVESWCNDNINIPFAPQFNGRSYLALNVAKSHKRFESVFFVEFLSTSSDGLIFHRQLGQSKTLYEQAIIKNGFIVHRYDCGLGVNEQIYPTAVTIGHWHTLNIIRRNCSYSSVTLDGRFEFVQDLQERLSNVYVVPSNDIILIGKFLEREQIPGFVGCIRSLKYNDQKVIDENIDFSYLAVGGSQIGACKSFVCRRFKNPCNNDGKCVYDPKKSTNFKCYCSKYFTGDTCAFESIESPQFSGHSYIEHSTPSDLIDHLYLQLQFKWKPSSRSLLNVINIEPELLFFAGDLNAGEYLIVYIQYQQLNMQFNLGGGNVKISAKNKLSPNQWQNASIWRTGRGGLLRLNDADYVEGFAPGEYTELFVSEHVSFGGLRHYQSVHQMLSGLQGFRGCFRNVTLNSKLVYMTAESTSMSNIVPCNSDPCKGIKHACGNNNCNADVSEINCACKYPLKGDLCESRSESIAVVSFRRNGYVKFNDTKIISRLNGDETYLQVSFKPLLINVKAHEEILINAGNKTAVNEDWFEMFINSKYQMCLRLNLGSGVAHLCQNKGHIVFGDWNTVTIIRNERQIQLTVNNRLTFSKISPGVFRNLNLKGPLYVGGLPYHQYYANQYGFNGCISEIVIGQNFRLEHLSRATEAINIEECKND